jgi:hypothetical protein
LRAPDPDVPLRVITAEATILRSDSSLGLRTSAQGPDVKATSLLVGMKSKSWDVHT